MTDRFKSLANGEVISLQQETQVLKGQKTFRAGEINDAIRGHLEKAIADWNEHNNDWFSSQGIDCEALRFGSNGWEKGRIRLCLEFCPDLPNPPDRGITSSIPKAINVALEPIGSDVSPPPAPQNSTIDPNVSSHVEPIVTTAIAAPEITAPTHDLTPIPVAEYLQPTEIADIAPAITTTSAVFAALPVVGITTIGAVAVAAIAAPELHEAVTNSIPHADTTLELEHPTDPNAPHHGGFDEIAFDFDLANNDRGIMIPNGMMELDLTDLDLDFSEHDLLNFENNGMSEVSEFINLQDLDRSAHSGMSIDEVWNEMNQADWPGIN